ncbi:MAG: hypothetical protein JWO58_1006 [Chitinophagaceae bacterium]|nr:hypothetical protein [Chitinophagaceae bacterium]
MMYEDETDGLDEARYNNKQGQKNADECTDKIYFFLHDKFF